MKPIQLSCWWLMILFALLGFCCFPGCATFNNKTGECTAAFERCWTRTCPKGGLCVAEDCQEMRKRCMESDLGRAHGMRLREEALLCPDCAQPGSRQAEGDR